MTSSVRPFAGRTMVMSGGSRGIGLAIAEAFSRAGGNVAILAKTKDPHPRLSGTIHTAVERIEAAGGRGVGVVGDVRSEDDVTRLVRTAADSFGGIDVVVNNASAIHIAGTLNTSAKQFGLMNDVNVRGTWLLSTAALPHLAETGGSILTLSPPLNLSPTWLGAHPAYTASKYAMTMLTLGWAAEFREGPGREVAAFCLWPETLIDTAAVRNVLGGSEQARKPTIVADAAMALLARPAHVVGGRTFIDAEVLRSEGVSDFDAYGPSSPRRDIFVD